MYWHSYEFLYLKAYGMCYMPVYCSRAKTLFLVDKNIWPQVCEQILYSKSYLRLRTKYIKRYKFVHDVYGCKFLYINKNRMDFLRYFKLIGLRFFENINVITCIASCWLKGRFNAIHRRRHYRTRIRIGYFSNPRWILS